MTEQEIIERAARVLCEAHNTYRARRLGTGLTFHEEAAALHAACLLRTALDEQAVEAVEDWTTYSDKVRHGYPPCIGSDGHITESSLRVYKAGRASLALKAAQQAAREPKWIAHRPAFSEMWLVGHENTPALPLFGHLTESQARAVAAALNADAEGKS